MEIYASLKNGMIATSKEKMAALAVQDIARNNQVISKPVITRGYWCNCYYVKVATFSKRTMKLSIHYRTFYAYNPNKSFSPVDFIDCTN